MIYRILCLIFIWLLPSHLLAYSSVTVPVDDPVYRQLDKLAAFGLLPTMMQGQRPYVRAEIGRLIAEAMEEYPKFEGYYREATGLDVQESGRRLKAKVYVDRILKDLKFRFKEELIQRGVLPGKVPAVQGRLLESIRGDFIYLDEPKSTIPPQNGLGGINAILQPLVEYREGRHYQSGTNWAFETQHWGRFSKYLSIQFQPRFQIQNANSPLESENKVFIQRLNGRLTFGKLDIEVGRDSLDWGPTPTGGLTFSSNPRPLDFIKISSVSPFHYPFLFKKLGRNEMSLVVANLGPEQSFKNPWLVAYKISSRRTPCLEFGFTQSLELGGEGAPPVGFGGVLAEFFDITSNDDNSYRAVALELLGRIPSWRGMELYLELNFADFTPNFNTQFIDNTSYLAGIHLPRLNYLGTWDLRLEYRRLAPRYSRSPIFIDGMTENRLLLGDPLGPDSQAVFLETHYEINPQNLLFFSFQYSRRNNTLYQINGNSVDSVANLGSEDRFLYRVRMNHWFNPHFEGRLGLGLEQVVRADFTPAGEFNWMGEVGFTFHLPAFYPTE